MRREFKRGPAVADLIQRELALLIQRELKDPRLGMTTITEVEVSRDLAFADVYFTVLPVEKSQDSEQVLDGASGFLRSQLAKRLSTRITPRLRFHYDETIDRAARLSKIINDAIARDNPVCSD